MNENKENEIEPSGEFAASIRDFRLAVTHVADRETAGPMATGWLASARKRRRNAHQRMALGWAVAVLLCIATLPAFMHSRHAAIVPAAAQTATISAPSAESDTVLLEQVDTDVSESVPSPLAPLTELDNLTNTSSDSTPNGALTQTETTNAAQQ